MLHFEFQIAHRPVPPSGDTEGARGHPPHRDCVRRDPRRGGGDVSGGGCRTGAQGACRA